MKKVIVNSDINNKIENYAEILGVNSDTMNKIVNYNPHVSEIKPESLKKKVEDLEKVFNDEARSVIIANSKILDLDFKTENQFDKNAVMKLDEQELRDSTSVKDKIKYCQIILGISEDEVINMVRKFPALLLHDVIKRIKNLLNYFQDTLHVDRRTLLQTVIACPRLLSYDSTNTNATSLKTKIQKMNEVMPMQEVLTLIIKNPQILSVPAQSFKLRYMLATISGTMERFLSSGFLTNEKKVYARLCFLQKKNPKFFNKEDLYRTEKVFAKRFNAKSSELMEKYLLDAAAIAQIEMAYQNITGKTVKLDQQERANLGLEVTL